MKGTAAVTAPGRRPVARLGRLPGGFLAMVARAGPPDQHGRPRR